MSENIKRVYNAVSGTIYTYDSDWKTHSINDEPLISADGVKRWYKHGLIHREGGLPAYVDDIKKIYHWRVDGFYYRENDMPSKVTPDERTWHKNGTLSVHRDNNLPAREYYEPDGTTVRESIWYKDGQIHRDDDEPAWIDYKNQTMKWYKNGEPHRDGDMPAVIINSAKVITKAWYNKGHLHRKNNPAVIKEGKPDEWYYHGIQIKAYHQHPFFEALKKAQELFLSNKDKTEVNMEYPSYYKAVFQSKDFEDFVPKYIKFPFTSSVIYPANGIVVWCIKK
jgi:hypothetical protein